MSYPGPGSTTLDVWQPRTISIAVPRRSGDTSIVASRLTSERFVGRATELSELELAARQAAACQPAVVLLGGDSGVGKTRLVGELERRLAGAGTLVLRGESIEQGDEELPYAPLTSALRPLVRARHPALGELSAGSRAQLAALLPGLEDAVPAEPRAERPGQLRLFEAVLELIDLLSQEQPVTLILEDMHWADRSTSTFISFLARGMRQERVMGLLTYRTDELHRRHPLRPLLAELERLENVRRIDLQPFDRAELTEVLGDILGSPPGEAVVERLYARSEGNALFTEELVAAGRDGRGAAPQSLRDAFLLRVERLSPEAQRAARAIAAGRRLDESMIAAVTGLDVPVLQAALRDAVSEQVLATSDRDDGRLRFRHALLREAVYDDLLPGERADLHLALAQALEERRAAGEHDPGLAGEMAHHYAAAGEQPAALRASVEAALAARDVHAYGEVAQLAERALELWPRVPGAEQLIPLDHVDVLSLAADAYRVTGDRQRAEVLLGRAIEEVAPESDPRRHARLLARLARVQWSLNRGPASVETAQRALALLPEAEAGPERASLMAWLARIRFLRGRFRDAIADGELALAAALEAGDKLTEGEVRNTLGMAQVVLGQVEQGCEELRKAIAIAREAEDPDDLGTAYSNLAEMLNLSGRTTEALGVAQEGLDLVPPRLLRSYDWMRLTVAQLASDAGQWQLAKDELRKAHRRPIGVLLIFRLLREAELALGVGDEERAASCLEEAEPLVATSSEPQWIGGFAALSGELWRRRRDLARARAAIDAALDRIELCTDDVMRIARVSAAGARVEADIAQRARDLREREQERDAVARARIHVRRLAAAAQEGGPVERAWHAVGKAELGHARGKDDAKLWLAAAEAWEAIERPYEAALSHWRAAEAHAQAERRPEATAAAQAALESAGRLGSRWLEREVRGLAARARLELDGAAMASAGDAGGAGAGGADGAAPEDPFGLTPRERQVLALIAEGATNRQIGAALFMAEKTASVHVSRILAKLGVHTRTQAAAVAHRLHLE